MRDAKFAAGTQQQHEEDAESTCKEAGRGCGKDTSLNVVASVFRSDPEGRVVGAACLYVDVCVHRAVLLNEGWRGFHRSCS